jgi:FixJ family two-component response regulator
MNQENYDLWTEFRAVLSNTLTKEDRQLIVKIFAEEFNRKITVDCGCSGKVWQQRINAINKLYDKG